MKTLFRIIQGLGHGLAGQHVSSVQGPRFHLQPRKTNTSSQLPPVKKELLIDLKPAQVPRSRKNANFGKKAVEPEVTSIFLLAFLFIDFKFILDAFFLLDFRKDSWVSEKEEDSRLNSTPTEDTAWLP